MTRRVVIELTAVIAVLAGYGSLLLGRQDDTANHRIEGDRQ